MLHKRGLTLFEEVEVVQFKVGDAESHDGGLVQLARDVRRQW